MEVAPPASALGKECDTLSLCYALILKNPEIIFGDPELGAHAFGIDLAKEFFVCDLPTFEPSMSLAEFEKKSQIKFMSPDMCAFLGVLPGQCSNQAAIEWLNTVCSPECVRQCVTTPMAPNCIRRWKHKKLYQKESKSLECIVRGFILPLCKVMFVDIESHILLADNARFEPTKFVWSDFDGLDFDGLNDGTFFEWDEDCAAAFLAGVSPI